MLGCALKVLDLFSGIGGFSLGLERAGMETVAFCEIEEFPRKILAKHWPDIPIYHDIRELTGDRLKQDGISVDLICGGFPCQDISTAGKQAGMGEGTKSGLWSECARLLGELRPRYAIFENVTALLSGEEWFEQILWDISQVGYDAEWHCISASCIGALHHRDRVWVIAYPQGNTIKNSIFQGEPRDQFFKGKPRGSNWRPIPGTSWEEDQPEFSQVDDGISDWVGDVSGYGNAVVPQIPEIIGRAVMELENV